MEHILFIKERFHVGGINNAETVYYLPHDDGCRWPHRFLDAGLVDEVSLLIGPAIDGREGEAQVFDGRQKDREPIHMQLTHIQKYEDDAVWLRYEVKNGSGK